jgi:hypothetical protein
MATIVAASTLFQPAAPITDVVYGDSAGTIRGDGTRSAVAVHAVRRKIALLHAIRAW